MICMSNACAQGKKLCPTPLTCSGFNVDDEAPINFQPRRVIPPPAPPSLPFERGCWDWLDSMRAAAMDELRSWALVCFGCGAAALVGGLAATGVYAGLVALGVVR